MRRVRSAAPGLRFVRRAGPAKRTRRNERARHKSTLRGLVPRPPLACMILCPFVRAHDCGEALG
jgi:hypothetical protein